MNGPTKPDGKQRLFSGRFVTQLLLVAFGIVLYLSLSHLSDLMNLLRQLYQIVWPFVMAFVVAWLMDPLVKFCEEKVFRKGKARPRRWLSIALTYIVMLALLAALLYVLLPQVYDSLLALIGSLPSYLEELQSAVNHLAEQFTLLDSEDTSFIVDTYSDLVTRLMGLVQGVLPQIINMGMSLGSGLVNILMALIASIYMLADKARLQSAARRCVYALVPAPRDEKLLAFVRQANGIFSGFINGKLLDSLIIGLLCLAGTLILRIPFAGLISLIVGVTNVIPVFGPFIGAIPSILILLIVDPWSALWFGIFVVALQQLDGNVIGPRILGDSCGVSALGVLVSITVAGSLMGVTGMLIGVPVYSILCLLGREYLDARLAQKQAGAEQAQPEAPAPEDTPAPEAAPASKTV